MSGPEVVPEVWERQTAESDEAWLAFRNYRDMPLDERMLKRAASIRLTTLSKWYREHNWDTRCRAYDAKFDKMRVEEREQIYRRQAREIAIDHMIMLADTRELYTREFAKLLEASRQSEMHGLIRTADLIRMAEVMVKLDRLVRGETTENVGTTEMDLGQLSVDEIRTLNELLEKAGKKDDEEADVPGH